LAAELVYESEFESAVESLIDAKVSDSVDDWFANNDISDVINGEVFTSMVINALRTILDRSDR